MFFSLFMFNIFESETRKLAFVSSNFNEVVECKVPPSESKIIFGAQLKFSSTKYTT